MRKYLAIVVLSAFFVLLFSSAISANWPVEYFSTYDYEEYKEFLETSEYAKDVVPCEKVSYLGDFYYYYINSDHDSFRIVTPAGKTVTVRLYWTDIRDLDEYTVRVNESADLRRYWNEVSGVVVINETWYYYTNGRLSGISWYNGEFCAYIKVSEDYPNVEGDLISQLLMRDTAEDAIEVLFGRKEFVRAEISTDSETEDTSGLSENSSIGSATIVPTDLEEPVSFPWLWVGIGGGAVVVICGAVVTAVILRKKRRKAADAECG